MADGLTDTIFDDLRRQILAGELGPGDRLPPERELATRYDTNRNTLREAVRRLEEQRLVTVRHGQGVTVSDFRRTGSFDLLGAYVTHAPDPREKLRVLLDLLPARASVLEFAAATAAERASESDVARLADLVAMLDAPTEQNDGVAVAVGFDRWLDALIDAGHSLPLRWIANPFLLAERDLLARLPGLFIVDPAQPAYLRRVVAAVQKGDRAAAARATRDHYAQLDARLLAHIRGLFGEADPVARKPEKPKKKHRRNKR